MPAVKKKPVVKKYIYWCHTTLPEYYSFYYGSSEPQVKELFGQLLSVEPEYIVVHRICEIPATVLKNYKLHEACDIAKVELVKSSGIEFLHDDMSAFRYKGKVRKEKTIFDKPNPGKGKLTVYLFKEKGSVRKVKEWSRFKIGHTKDIGRRLKQLSKPYKMELTSNIRTDNARILERELIKHFGNFKIDNEDIELDRWGSFLLLTVFQLYAWEFSDSKVGHQRSKEFEYMMELLKPYIENHRLDTEPPEDKQGMVVAIYKHVEEKLMERDDKILEDHFNKILKPSGLLDAIKKDI